MKKLIFILMIICILQIELKAQFNKLITPTESKITALENKYHYIMLGTKNDHVYVSFQNGKWFQILSSTFKSPVTIADYWYYDAQNEGLLVAYEDNRSAVLIDFNEVNRLSSFNFAPRKGSQNVLQARSFINYARLLLFGTNSDGVLLNDYYSEIFKGYKDEHISNSIVDLAIRDSLLYILADNGNIGFVPSLKASLEYSVWPLQLKFDGKAISMKYSKSNVYVLSENGKIYYFDHTNRKLPIELPFILANKFRKIIPSDSDFILAYDEFDNLYVIKDSENGTPDVFEIKADIPKNFTFADEDLGYIIFVNEANEIFSITRPNFNSLMQIASVERKQIVFQTYNTENSFVFKFEEERDYKIEIYDILANKLATYNTNSSLFEIPYSSFNTRICFAKVYVNGEVFVQKLIY